MSRRITFTAGAGTSREKAIQPDVDDLLKRLLAAAPADEKTRIAKGRPRMTVIQDSVTEEVITDQTGSSRVNHRRETLIILEVEKEATKGNEAPVPNESDRRLVKLVTTILKRIDKLLYDSFLNELFRESGKEVARVLWILIALFLIHWVLPLITR